MATPRGPRMTPALYPVNAARYYNDTLHQRYNATLHQTNARHTAPVWRPTCSTERRRRQQYAAPAGATDAHKLHYKKRRYHKLDIRKETNDISDIPIVTKRKTLTIPLEIRRAYLIRVVAKTCRSLLPKVVSSGVFVFLKGRTFSERQII